MRGFRWRGRRLSRSGRRLPPRSAAAGHSRCRNIVSSWSAKDQSFFHAQHAPLTGHLTRRFFFFQSPSPTGGTWHAHSGGIGAFNVASHSRRSDGGNIPAGSSCLSSWRLKWTVGLRRRIPRADRLWNPLQSLFFSIWGFLLLCWPQDKQTKRCAFLSIQLSSDC